MKLNEITYLIRKAIFQVHITLGPGLLESVYESALANELCGYGLNIKRQVPLPVIYKGEKLELGFRIDIIVNEDIIIELKSVEQLQDIHKKQLLTYLKLSGLKLGILVNFNVSRIVDKESLIRIIN